MSAHDRIQALPFEPGTRVGSYEITAHIGSGGMGEVYRATDTTLKRQVAVKVLPEALASDADRLTRFQREAELLASLNHPNIAHLYGVEITGPTRALVMELVEGPTLADRIAAGPLPVDEALAIAKQVAEALDAAHDQGIVHRDLKPANVKVRPDGTVKVLDFGLAKALEPAGAFTKVNASLSPTITSPAMTRAGMILGTAAYMSPEQARGKAVDERADIWAFGCVLFEMLTGTRAFPGEDVSETLAAVLKSEPDWSRLPSSTSPDVHRLLRRALAKDPARRLADIRDARLDLDETAVSGAGRPRVRSLTRERLLWSAAITALGIAIIVSWRDGRPAGQPVDPVVDTAPLRTGPALHVPATTEPASVELSPDGRWVVFVASTDGRPKLWLQSLSTTEKSRPLRGTDGASYPSWSPDSRSICFFSNEQLYRLDIDGGVPMPLTVAPVGTGCSWSGDGRILYTAVPDAGVAIFPPPAGAASGLLPSLRLERGQRFPQFLPDDRHFLYYEVETRAVMLGSTDSSVRRQLFVADAAPKVVPPDELLFVLDSKLYVQTFDPGTFALTGTRRELGGDVAIDDRGAAAASACVAGSVLFRTGSGDRARRLTEVGRDGAIRRVILERETGSLVNINLSADGRKLIFNKTSTGNTNIVELDLDRGVLTTLTTTARPEIMPLYLADGRVLFAGPGSRDQGFVVNKMVPASPPEEVPVPPGFPMDARADGTFLFRQFRIPDSKATGWDIWVGHVDGKTPPQPLLETEAIERTAQFSPDGNWFAYESRSAGADTFEVFVQSYPLRPGTRKQVSSGGGSQVRWVGNEIFYVSADGFLTSVSAVPSEDGRDLVLGTGRQRLFPLAVESTIEGGIQHTYAAFPDGHRFIVSTYLELPADALTLILHRPRNGEKR